jgi:hypothetical protein
MVYQVVWNQMQLLEFDIACGDSIHFSWAGEMHGLSNTNGLDCKGSKVLQDIVPLSIRGDAQVKFDRAGTYYFFCRGALPARWPRVRRSLAAHVGRSLPDSTSICLPVCVWWWRLRSQCPPPSALTLLPPPARRPAAHCAAKQQMKVTVDCSKSSSLFSNMVG